VYKSQNSSIVRKLPRFLRWSVYVLVEFGFAVCGVLSYHIVHPVSNGCPFDVGSGWATSSFFSLIETAAIAASGVASEAPVELDAASDIILNLQ